MKVMDENLNAKMLKELQWIFNITKLLKLNRTVLSYTYHLQMKSIFDQCTSNFTKISFINA